MVYRIFFLPDTHTRVVGILCSGAQGRDRYLVGRRHTGGGYARLPKVVGNTCMIEGRNSRGATFFSYLMF